MMAQAASMSGTEAPMSSYPIAMGADLGIVKAQLKEHMVWMHISSGIDSELVLHLCKDCLLDIRTIYLGSETVAFIDYVPSATMPNPVLAKAGTHTVGKARVIVDTALASDKVDPSFLEDYANLITKGRSKVIKKDYLINNSRWRNEADITPPATVYSLGEEAALNRSGNQPSSSTPTSKKTFFDEVLRGVQGLNHEDLTSLISALMMEDKQRGTKTAATIKPSMVGNPVPFKAGGGVADVSAIPQHSSPIGNIPSQQTVQPPVPPFNLNHPTGSQPSGLPPPPTYNTINQHRGTQPVGTHTGNYPTRPVLNPKANPSHVPCQPMNYADMEKSFQAMSEGIIRAVVSEGVLRHDIPKLDAFSGKADGEKVSWRKWELQVKGLEGSYTDKAIKEAMLKALKGDAFAAAEPLSGVCTWQQLLEILRGKFTTVHSLDVLMGQFYQIAQGLDTVAQFAIKLEHHLGSIRNSHPGAVSDVDFFRHLRERFFHGLSERMRSSLRHKYDDKAIDYHSLLAYARVIEGETGMSAENEKNDKQEPAKAVAKGSAIQKGNDVDKLTKAFATTQGELHKLQKQLQDITQVVGQWAQVQATGFQAYVPAPSQGNSYQGQRGRGRGINVPHPPNQPNNQQFGQDRRGHGAPRHQPQQQRGTNQPPRGNQNQQLPEQGQAVRPGNWNRLCFWCRDYAPADQANHLIKNCPYYNQGRKDWWTQQGVTSDNPDPASVGHTPRQGPN